MAPPLEYPSWLYSKDRKPQLVTSATLGARMLEAGWSDTPKTFQKPEAIELDLDPLGLGTDEQLAAADAEKKAAEDEAIRAASMHAQTGPVIIAGLETVTDIEQLEKLRAREQSNPDHVGGRKTVLAALDARLAALIG